MRKVLLVMAVMMSVLVTSVKAQSFEFQYQGKSLEDGATVTIAAEPNAFGELSCETNPSSDPNNGLVLKLPEGYQGKVQAVLSIQQNTLNASILQWCMGGECVPVTEDTQTKNFEAEGIVQVQFDATAILEKGNLQATLTVTIGLESHQVMIQFSNDDMTGMAQRLKTDEKNHTVYDLKGCRIKDKGKSGVYIVSDGSQKRKVIVNKYNH